MTDRTNHHYVPQFYFKQFSKGRPRIHLLLTKHGRIVCNASIRGQCARTNFYGSKQAESLLSQLEARHSVALKKMIEIAWSRRPPALIPNDFNDLAWLWEAVVIQRARTLYQAEKLSPMMESMALEQFRQIVKYSPDIENRETLINAIEVGDVTFSYDRRTSVGHSIASAFEAKLLISDLGFYVIRNHTDYPFIFSDSPVVFYNTYYKNVTRRGVLGLQTPGLQIFYPLDSRTLLMFVDDEVYSGRFKGSLVCDVWERSDVSQMNALQLHHSHNAVYFGTSAAREYLLDLWQAHKSLIAETKAGFAETKGWLLDGKPVDGTLYVGFEPQLNLVLNLSFIDCTPIEESQYRFRRRSPELFEEHKRRKE